MHNFSMFHDSYSIVEVFSRRLQGQGAYATNKQQCSVSYGFFLVQERLTRQIAEAIEEAIQPRGVAVIVECVHMCMVMRGAQKVNSHTTTSAMLGTFHDDPKTREEFLMLSGIGSKKQVSCYQSTATTKNFH